MNIFSLSQSISIVSIFKVFFLVLLGIYSIFIFMLLNKIRSFDKIISLSGTSGGGLIKFFTLLYLLALIFTFVLAVVIV